MKLSDFDYDLPPECIAQTPVRPRDAARLLVHSIDADMTEHRLVRDLPQLLAPGDLLVLNDTRVRPARLCGRRATGGAVELLVVGPAGTTVEGEPLWRALVNPARRLRAGERLEMEDGALEAHAVERLADEHGRLGGEWSFVLRDPRRPEATLDEILESVGRMPLPPYIRRGRARDPQRQLDRERYQTVFAREAGAIAAPTAGLHFTAELFAALAARDVERTAVTLHVGLGTFRPVTAEDLDSHQMHTEPFDLPQEAAQSVHATGARGGRVVAVGTTVTRVLESCADESGRLRPGAGETSLFVRPGYSFRVVDALLTNFHLPRSTLLMLVSALAGRERVLRLYREAIDGGYRFFSYGDAMLLLP